MKQEMRITVETMIIFVTAFIVVVPAQVGMVPIGIGGFHPQVREQMSLETHFQFELSGEFFLPFICWSPP